MQKALIALVVIIVLAGGYFVWRNSGVGTPTAEPSPAPSAPTTATYATSTFSITYPSDFILDENYAYQGVPNKPIPGVKFTVPASATAGTNLSSDSGVSIESLPRATSCTGDIYLLDNVKALDLTVGSTTYSVATTTGAGAGNIYEEHVYAIKGSKPCTAVRYFIHYGNIGNYPTEGEGAVREFDKNALVRQFDSIRNTLQLRSAI